MDPNGRRDKTRRIVIITLSAAIAGLTTALAASYERIGMGLAVATGYIILFMSAALVNSFLHNSASDTKRMFCLVFSICVLLLFLGGMAYLLFNQKDEETIKSEITEEIVIPEIEEEIKEETAEPDEIAIPSAPRVMWTVRIDDSSPHPVSEEPSDEISLQDEKSLRDSSETTVVIDSEKTSSESAALIPEDPVFIGSMIRSIEDEIPSAPVFIESSVKAVEKDPVAIPDTPIFIEASIDEINENETAIVPVIIGGADAETEIQIEEPVVEESTTETPSTSNNDFFSGLSPEEADFWADFYIAGEDELELADGIYYMDLYINDNYTGYIETIIEDGAASIHSDELYSYISENVEQSLLDLIFADDSDYILLDDLSNLGVGVNLDGDSFSVYLTFSTADMPVQILSIRGTPRGGSYKPIAGGLRLDPAAFILRSNYSLSGTLSNLRHFDLDNSMRFTFSSTNNGRLYDLYFNFNYYMYFGASYFDFVFGSYNFYVDFEEPMIRLSFGNVSSDVLYPDGRSVGIRFDRSYVYGGPDASRGSQIESMLIVEKRSEVIIYNEGREIFRRVLDPGRYRLQDFILYSGANEILIRIEPLDGSPAEEMTMDINYSSSLIAPGDFYYGGALVTGRNIVSRDSRRNDTLSIPIWNSRYLEYDWRNITASFYLKTGLTQSLSLSTTLALQNKPVDGYDWNPRIKLNTELTHANILGTTRYNLNVDEHFNDSRNFGIPGIYARIGHQVATGWNYLSSVNLGFTYSNPEELNRESGHRLSLSTSLSGRVGILNWNTGFTGTLYTDKLSEFIWSWSNTLSLNISRNFWMSGSLILNGTGPDTSVSGRVYATVRFDGGSVSASSSIRDLSVSASYQSGKHSVSGNFNINDFTDFRRYSIGAGYSYNGEYINFNSSVDSDILFNYPSLNLSLSTSTVFADGLFAIGSSVPSNFLMIRQKGALKSNNLSVGVPGRSSANELAGSFGTYVYTGLSSTRGTSFSLYSSSDNSFGNSASFDINIPYSDRMGYVLRLDAEETYSVAGYAVLPDGTVWSNNASPLYQYVEDEAKATLIQTENYVFSDADGLFVISNLQTGTYAFDISTEDGWVLAVFTVDSTAKVGTVQMLKVSNTSNTAELPDIYSGYLGFAVDQVLSAEAFWKLIYPEMEEVA